MQTSALPREKACCQNGQVLTMATWTLDTQAAAAAHRVIDAVELRVAEQSPSHRRQFAFVACDVPRVEIGEVSASRCLEVGASPLLRPRACGVVAIGFEVWKPRERRALSTSAYKMQALYIFNPTPARSARRYA